MRHARPDYNRIQDPAGLIPDDEPVFLLRGQDIAAPEAIEAWVREARTQGADEAILDAATAQAEEMRAWQGQGLQGRWKVPDLSMGDLPLEMDR